VLAAIISASIPRPVSSMVLNISSIFAQEFWFLYSSVVGVSESHRVSILVDGITTELAVILTDSNTPVAVMVGSGFRDTGLTIELLR